MKNVTRLLLILAFTLSSFVSAASRIESWKNGEELELVVRNANGTFKTWGTLKSESWSDDEASTWVARRENGTFVSGYTGTLEKFALIKGQNETLVLVIRNSKGEFVTWKSLEGDVTAQFEKMDYDRDGKKESIFAVRMNGKFLNWAPAKLEKWESFSEPVLVARESADTKRNGKLLGWIAPTISIKNGKKAVNYHHPISGEFMPKNK